MRLHLNITTKLVGYLLVAGVVPLLVYGIGAFQVAREIVIRQAAEYNLRLVSEAATYWQLYRNQVEDLAANVAGNDSIARALHDVDQQPPNNYEILNTKAQIGYLLNSFVRVKGLESINLFTLKGTHFHIGETLNVSSVKFETVAQMLKESEASNSVAFWRGIEDNINSSSRQKKVVTLTRPIRHYAPETGTNNIVGLLVVNLNDDIFRDYFRNDATLTKIRMMVIDRHGRLMYHFDRSLIGQQLAPELLAMVRDDKSTHQLQLDGEVVIMTTIPMPKIDGYLIFAAPLALQTAPVNRLAATGVLLLLLSLAVLAVLTRYSSKTVVTPLKAISDGFSKLSKNPDDVHAPLPVPAEHDEIATLIKGFNAHIEALAAQRSDAAELKRMEQSATESAHILRAAIEAIGEAFAVYDEQDRLIFSNDKYRSMNTTLADSKPRNHTFEQLARDNAEHGIYPDAIGQVDEWVRMRLTKHQSGSTDIEQKLVDGRWLRILNKKTPGGHIVSFAIDITHLKKMQEKAEAANAAKSVFLSNMSHEIRTPMNGILGMANILRREGVTPKQEDRLDKIDRAGKHLLSVINDILDISKIEAGKFILEEALIDFTRLMTNVTTILFERVQAKGLKLLVEIRPFPANLYGDLTRLQQALLNFATNAIKFTEKGSVKLHIFKQEETSESMLVRFEVQDTGIGIPQEALTRIFDAFEQADNSTTRKYGGTGLGLAITKRLAELMGGNAGAESTPGVGSTFWFTARLRKGEEVAVTPPAMHEDNAAVIRQRYHDRRILVVDDDPVNREVALIQLEDFGLVVDTAEDGAVAVDLAKKTPYAVILMDMQMPNLNGLDATRQIRKIPGYRETPIIAITANAFSEDKVRCLEAGMNDYITKPFHPDELSAIMLKWLGQQG